MPPLIARVGRRFAAVGLPLRGIALTLGAIVKELQGIADQLTVIEAAPPLQVTPGTIAQQIRDEAVGLAAQNSFERERQTLAQVAFLQQRAQRDRGVLWVVGSGVALIGAVLGTMLFLEINRQAPDDWGWSAGWAAWLMQADATQAGYKLIDRDNPRIAAALNEDSAGQRLCRRAAQV